MPAPRIRPAVRALVLDEDDAILLVEFRWDRFPDGLWACPGGGIDPGETPVEALRRELAEELGLDDAPVEGPVFHLTRLFPMTGWDGQQDTWYVVRGPRFEPQPRVDLLDENVYGMRWFTRAEIAEGRHAFSPRDLGPQLDRVLADGIPDEPYQIPALDTDEG